MRWKTKENLWSLTWCRKLYKTKILPLTQGRKQSLILKLSCELHMGFRTHVHEHTQRGEMVLARFPLPILPFCTVKYYKKCLAQSNFSTHTAEWRERWGKKGQMDIGRDWCMKRRDKWTLITFHSTTVTANWSLTLKAQYICPIKLSFIWAHSSYIAKERHVY